MELEEAEKLYKSYGGNPDELQNCDFDDLDYMIEIQKKIFSLTNKQDEEEQTTLEEELETLNLKLAVQELNSDSYRDIQNEIIARENRIRSSLGMMEKPLYVLDSSLMKLLVLDGYHCMGKNCREYLKGIEDLGERKDLQDRLENISRVIIAEFDRDERETAFLLYASTTLAECKSVPIAWILDKGEVLETHAYKSWYIKAQSLRSNLEKKIRFYESIETNLGEQVDKRNSVFRMYEKVCNLLERGGDSGN